MDLEPAQNQMTMKYAMWIIFAFDKITVRHVSKF